MITGELRRYVEEEIKKQVNIILSGSTGTNDQFSETIENLFPGMPNIESRPVMHPYGISSRAPRGTISVVGRQGAHAGNRLTLGHRDKSRPAVEEGEVQLYNQFGQAVYLKNGSVHIGSAGASNPATLGNEISQMLKDLITLISTHTHPYVDSGNPAITAQPVQATQFVQIKVENVDSGKIVSQEVFLEKGG